MATRSCRRASQPCTPVFGASSSALPAVFSIDHSSPSGCDEANHDSAPPISGGSRPASEGEQRLEGARCHARHRRAAIDQIRSRAADEQHDRGRGQALDHADRQVDRQHQQQEGRERQAQDAGGDRLQHHAERAELQADHRRDHRYHGDPAVRCARPHQQAVDERVGDEAREHAEVEDVGAEREQAAVREEQGLHRQH
ncbi:MAG: hypothetical protein U5L03_15740 [Burkholderiaceae bacterium]|nr:hypothetical protein [Burkholderiaceae bacterium]